MKFFPLGLAIACALLVCGDMIGFGQSPDQARADAVRVTMSMHPDGSRTVYNFDAAQHKAVAITTGQDGKLRETIRYVLDDTGRFSSAEVSGPDDHLRLKSRYKYDDAGRILEEDRLQLRLIRKADRLFRLRCIRQTSERQERRREPAVSLPKTARESSTIIPSVWG